MLRHYPHHRRRSPFNVLGGLLKADLQLRRGVICSWAVEDNLWLRRSAILAQLKYKADTDVELLCAAIEPSMGDNNFFARKAIGWALREYTRTDPDFVIAYVKHHKDALSNLSKREAWKLLIKNGFVDAIP
ncbi:MAG: DNA alkylation repair protein [Pseudomonadota bacterium]